MSPLDNLYSCQKAIDFDPSSVNNGLFIREADGNAIYTTPFPLSSIGYTFSKELAKKIGTALGKEVLAFGRNSIRIDKQDYSEEEVVSARLASNIVSGIEEEGAICVVKYPFFFNNCFANVYLEKRTLFERFIKPFELFLKGCSPSIVECAANLINGKLISDCKNIIDNIKSECSALIAVSDIGISKETNAFNSGIDLLFDGKKLYPSPFLPKESIADINKKLHVTPHPCDMELHRKPALELALESTVLLENKGILPLEKDYTVILIKGTDDDLVKELGLCLAEEGYNVLFLKEKEALKLQNTEKKTVVFLTNIKESLVRTLLDKSVKIIAVAFNEIHPLHKELDGVFFCKKEKIFLTGIAKLLAGECSPSGRLAYTLDEQNQIEKFEILLKEGVYYGYKRYDKCNLSPLYPFGYGLSYATFSYTNLECTPLSAYENSTLKVKAVIRNNSNIKGMHSALLFVKGPKTRISKPVKKLIDFEKAEIMPHQEKSILFTLNTSDFAYYNAEEHGFYVETGIYKLILIGERGEEILSKEIQILSKKTVAPPTITPAYYEDISKALLYPDESFKRLCLDGVKIDKHNMPLKTLKSAKNKILYHKIRGLFKVFLKENPQVIINDIDDLPLRLLRVLGESSLLESALNRIEGDKQ